MEISKLITNEISSAADGSISDSSFDILLNKVFDFVSGKSTEALTQSFQSTTEKTVYSGLMRFLLEASKHNADLVSVSGLLEDCKMDSNRISMFLKKYQENKEGIQHQLQQIGTSFDHIVDVKWRQDYVIKSNNCEKICEPSYIISLKTTNPHHATTENVTFSCTLEQLQDLVQKLKDSTKCLERNSTQ